MSRGAPLAAAALFLAGCGYRVAGHSDLLPSTIHTIAIPAFGNATTRYRLSERLPGAITREFITRTRYRIVPDPRDADAILEGTVLNYVSYPVVFDPVTSRASVVQMYVTMRIELRDKAGKVLFSRPGMEMKQRYEISVDPKAYFEESDAALDRMSHDVALNIVSAILENF